MPDATVERWSTLSVDEVAETYAGGTPSRRRSEYFGGEIPWVKSGEVNQGRIRGTEETITASGLEHSSAKWVPAGSVLVAMYGATAGKVATLEIDATINQAILAVVGKNGVASNEFLHYALTSAAPTLLRRVQGSGQPNLSGQLVRTLELNVPPLPEQRKIATILSSVDAAIDKTQAVIDQVKVVKNGLMQELLTRGLPGRHKKFKMTDIGEVPEEWDILRVEEIAQVVDSLHQTPSFSDTGFAMIRVADVKTGRLDLSKAARVNEEVFRTFTRKYLPRRGDVVFSRVGTYGQCCYIDTDEPLCLGQNTALISPECHGPFLYYQLLSPSVRTQVERTVTGSSQKTVSLRTIKDLQIAVPSLEEQSKLAEILIAMDERTSLEKRAMHQLLSAKAALMSVLLNGEVRVTPDPEP